MYTCAYIHVQGGYSQGFGGYLQVKGTGFVEEKKRRERENSCARLYGRTSIIQKLPKALTVLHFISSMNSWPFIE